MDPVKMTCLKPFTWAHAGIRVVEHQPGEEFLAEEDLVEVALARGWARCTDAPKAPPKPKAPAGSKAPPKPEKGSKGPRAGAEPPAEAGGSQ